MAIEKQKARKTRPAFLAGDKQISTTINGTTTTAIVELGMVAQKITVQALGDAAGTFEVTANGTNWVSGGSFTATTLNSYSTHNCVAVKLTRTSGSGQIVIIAA